MCVVIVYGFCRIMLEIDVDVKGLMILGLVFKEE